MSAKGFCVICGVAFGSDLSLTGRSLLGRIGILAIFAGLSLFLVGYLIWQVHNQGHGPGYDWISSWYDETYVSYSRRGAYTHQRGADVLTWIFLAGSLLIFGGTSALLPDPHRRKLFDHGDPFNDY